MVGGLVGIGSIQSKRETMQCLNDQLTSYLERLRSLEVDIRDWRAKSGDTWRRRDPRLETRDIISRP